MAKVKILVELDLDEAIFKAIKPDDVMNMIQDFLTQNKVYFPFAAFRGIKSETVSTMPYPFLED